MEKETNKKPFEKARLYARNTTNTRCSHLGRCDGCTIRYCDYRSRYESYIKGWEDSVG